MGVGMMFYWESYHYFGWNNVIVRTDLIILVGMRNSVASDCKRALQYKSYWNCRTGVLDLWVYNAISRRKAGSVPACSLIQYIDSGRSIRIIYMPVYAYLINSLEDTHARAYTHRHILSIRVMWIVNEVFLVLQKVL